MAIQLTFDVELSKAKSLQFLKSSLSLLKFAKSTFDRSEEVDTSAHNHFISVTIPQFSPLNLEERALVTKSLSYVRDEETFKRIPDSLSKYPLVHMFQSKLVEGNGDAWGKCVGVIDACSEEVLAHFWVLNTNELEEKYEMANGFLNRFYKEIDGRGRSSVFSAAYKFPPPFANRQANTWNVWDKLESFNGNEAYIVCYEPHKIEEAKRDPNLIPLKLNGIYVIEKLAPNISRLTMITNGDAGGSIPKWLMNTLIQYTLSVVVDVQDKFRRADKTVDKVSSIFSFPF